jgi:hypothetical protein
LFDIVRPDDRDACVSVGHSRADASPPQIRTEAGLLRRSGDTVRANYMPSASSKTSTSGGGRPERCKRVRRGYVH